MTIPTFNKDRALTFEGDKMILEISLLVFAIVLLLELVAFAMQRTTLLISRELNVSPKITELLLPKWFPLVWAVRILKWLVLIYIGYFISIWIAVGLLVLNVILSTFLPIPYQKFVSIFKKRIEELKTIDLEAGEELEQMLEMASIIKN